MQKKAFVEVKLNNFFSLLLSLTLIIMCLEKSYKEIKWKKKRRKEIARDVVDDNEREYSYCSQPRTAAYSISARKINKIRKKNRRSALEKEKKG